MQRVCIELRENWDTLDEAIAYFLAVSEDLKVLKRLSEQPVNIYIRIEGAGLSELSEEQRNELTIMLLSL